MEHAVITAKDEFVAMSLSKALLDISKDSSLELFGNSVHVMSVLIGDQERKFLKICIVYAAPGVL